MDNVPILFPCTCTQTGRVLSTGTCSDGAKNGRETDVDCGGFNSPAPGAIAVACPKCKVGQRCEVIVDCTTRVCIGGICRPTGYLPSASRTPKPSRVSKPHGKKKNQKKKQKAAQASAAPSRLLQEALDERGGRGAGLGLVGHGLRRA